MAVINTPVKPVDDHEDCHMAFYRLTSAGDYEPIPLTSDGILRSGVLPGFQFRVQDLYDQPSLLELSSDPVYEAFVLPEYREAELRAKVAETRAEVAVTRAEVVESRAAAEASARRALEEEIARLRAEISRKSNDQ